MCVYVLCHCDILCTWFELNKLFNKSLLKYDACLYLVVDRFLHICAYSSYIFFNFHLSIILPYLCVVLILL